MRGNLIRRRMGATIIALVVLGIGCENATGPKESIAGPSDLTADAVGTTTVRVSWKGAEGDDVSGYEVERRADLQGEFEIVQANVPHNGTARVSWFDTKVEANRFYGYRVRAVSKLGAKSSVSNVAGTKTASMPGLVITTTTVTPNPESSDPDGYTAVIQGQRDTQSVALGISGQRLVPLKRGTYSVVLRGMAKNCATSTAADTMKQATVTDEGVQTVAAVSFNVSCRDPRKASIVVAHLTAGDAVDADGFELTMSGIILEPGTPANERVYFRSEKLTGASGAMRFDNLRLGDYDVTIADVDAPCVLDGAARRSLQPRALAVDTVKFALTCRKPAAPVDTVGKPFVLRQRWSSATARVGDKVSLLSSLDLRAQASQQAQGVSAAIDFDNALVRYDSARNVGVFENLTYSKTSLSGVAFAAFMPDGTGKSGDIQIVRSWFTVVGAAGSSARTTTTLAEVLTPTNLAVFTNKVRVEEATLSITSGSGAPTNQSPTAAITAPATGTVGTAVTFSGSGSRDSDGTIASYAWNFGNGGAGTGVSASHTYSSAGTFAVRLTVTDDRGATATADHSIVISAANATTGTVSGAVTSAQGPVAGATVTVTGGGTATTSATGTYSIANVASGARTLTVSTLPSGCTAPAAQTVTVAAGATATVNFTVVCTTNATTGTVSGKVTQGAAGAGIAGVQVVLQPTGGTALAAVTTSADGSYTVSNVPIGTGASAGAGSITLSALPATCTNPGSQSYTALAAGGTVTKDIAVICQAATLGTVSGTLTKRTGGPLAGVQLTLTPTGGTALAAVTTSATGAYTISGVAVGGGTIAVGAVPSGCTSPGAQSYTGVTAGGTVTKDITVTCAAGPFSYPFSATWGPITNTGPTGRQVALTFALDMGAAPGRADVSGANADSLAGISFSVSYNGTKLDYLSRVLLSPGGELDLGIVNEIGANTAGAQAVVAIGSTSGQTVGGNIQLIKLTFNIATGANGSVTPTVVITEALATTGLVNVTSSVSIVPLPVLTIP